MNSPFPSNPNLNSTPSIISLPPSIESLTPKSTIPPSSFPPTSVTVSSQDHSQRQNTSRSQTKRKIENADLNKKDVKRFENSLLIDENEADGTISPKKVIVIAFRNPLRRPLE